jgi:hypothetical protein
MPSRWRLHPDCVPRRLAFPPILDHNLVSPSTSRLLPWAFLLTLVACVDDVGTDPGAKPEGKAAVAIRAEVAVLTSPDRTRIPSFTPTYNR